ncbi:DUF3302 domain-containing protein, partial [Atlantibacter subterraneus]|uniref:DUF3302 domain-containing protein n=1 Tax=Atlantibacter subterraneus TaxID=255519 RepID=UPI00296528EB
KIGPDPRNFNQRVSLGRNDLLIRTFLSLFTLHVIWPFLWIWATLYRPERGWGMQDAQRIDALNQRIIALENELARQKNLQKPDETGE